MHNADIEIEDLIKEQEKIDVNKPAPDGSYPLYTAFQNDNYEEAKRLLQDPAIDVGKAEKNQRSFLCKEHHDPEIIQLLLEKKSSHRIHVAYEVTLGIVFEILKKNPELLKNDIEFYGCGKEEYFAKLAALRGQTFIDFYNSNEMDNAICLLQQMEPITIKSKIEAETLFILIKEEPSLLEKAIFCQPDEDFVNWDEFHQQLMEQRENRLLDRIERDQFGVDIDALLALEDISLDKVLLSHLKFHHFDCFEKILKHDRANVNVRNHEDKTLLHLVLNLYDLSYAKLLLQHKDVDVNATDNDGNTPLHVAAGSERLNFTIQQLLGKKDIRVNEKNNAGKTPFDIAWESSAWSKVNTLLECSGQYIVSAFRTMLENYNFTDEKQHSDIAIEVNKQIDKIEHPHHLLDIVMAIGIGNGNAPGIDDELSKLRYRQEYHHAFLKGDFGYRETNDSEEIARKIIERAKDILEKNNYQVKDQAEYAIYLNLFDRQITRYNKTKDQAERQELVTWLKENAVLPEDDIVENNEVKIGC